MIYKFIEQQKPAVLQTYFKTIDRKIKKRIQF